MKCKVTIVFAVILSIALLLLEFGSGRVWSFVTQEENPEAKESINVNDASMTKEVNHSIYKSKEQCFECHPRLSPSHMFSKPLIVSENLPLDFEGKITCVTCHNCTTSKCVFRKNKRELCNVCHDCTQGMSCIIGVAHLGNSENIEHLANTCLACHDGVEGPFRNPEGKMINKYYKIKKSFRDISYSNIVLLNGKVTCISCHNPYENEDKKLVMSNEGSRLCLTCHIK
ncbi:MAG: cytochrome c3 family protein [Nitrospirota bacterium]